MAELGLNGNTVETEAFGREWEEVSIFQLMKPNLIMKLLNHLHVFRIICVWLVSLFVTMYMKSLEKALLCKAEMVTLIIQSHTVGW